MISLRVNGKAVELEKPVPLLDYLEQIGLDARAVAVEHNGEIIERAAYGTVTLRDGDRVEIVRMVGGGWRRGRKTRRRTFGAQSLGAGFRPRL